MQSRFLLVGLFLFPMAFAPLAHAQRQPELGARDVPVLQIAGLKFKDLDRNGKLDPYEDWRLSPEERAKDLVGRLSLEEAAGLMVHGTLPSFGPMAVLGVGKNYDLAKAQQMMQQKHVRTFITRLSAKPSAFAHENNEVQALAEKERWGIPVTISSDPRHHFQQVIGASVSDATFSLWPEPLGFAAIGDAATTRRFADVVRQEYIAVGIRESLAPQADLLTEPRWARSNGTFGSDPQVVKQMVEAYVAGVQNGPNGLNPGSVAAVVKHWVGYGAAKDGWDSHNYYGRYATFPANNFAQHLVPFTGAFTAKVASVMPTYSILQGLKLQGKPVEQVGAGFNRQLLTGLLRDTYHFKGVILSDWAVTDDCSERCREGAPAGQKPTPADIGMSWGVGDLTHEQRFVKAINAGVDQLGGTEESDLIVDAVHKKLISQERVNAAAFAILVQKFQMGLFEQPYVDEAKASVIAGNAKFVAEGEQAQAAAAVVLQNKAAHGKQTLPLAAATKVYLYGIKPEAAKAIGLTVVDDPSQAEVAIVRAPAPYQSEHTQYFFGSRQHEGRLAFATSDEAYAKLLSISERTPTIFVTTLERPLILTNVLPHATAVIGDFGIGDAPLLKLLTGQLHPQGHLPFNLPSSPEAVAAQKSDLPDDDANPLFKRGFGLSY
ncbi:glycoside hydrolase family 3 N-terminal domain-containing protein [Granulicella cerasi]|uniref:beta-glucosidase n=1 Tax=Granulicella cerasi TaxID=741063 RepID=A0ABW1Z8J3_9BACT|nr:glycoside hydrolase family 3 N-terminal domain-containing protein [Granulicella cerasi]